jgi:hypothetical protein
MGEVPVDAGTVVVRVDEVIQAPEALSHYAGQDITVLLPAKKRLKKGQQLVFYTNGLLFGDSVAVQAMDHHEVEKMPAALALASGGDPVKNLAVKDVQARVSSADVIVSGRVTSVRVPSDMVAARAAGAADPTAAGPISEHDPDWRIGEIQVDQVHKGSHKGRIEVRFPNSPDVMWHDAPKFHSGQEGFFILHKSTRETVAAKAAPTDDTGDYVALHPVDFQSFDEPGGIRNLLGL